MSDAILKFVRDDILDLDAGEQSEFESQLVELVSCWAQDPQPSAQSPSENAMPKHTSDELQLPTAPPAHS